MSCVGKRCCMKRWVGGWVDGGGVDVFDCDGVC